MEEDSDNHGSITLEEGLSAQTLEVLFGFLNNQYGENVDGVVNSDDLISPDHICTAYTETDMDVIMQTIGRLQQAKTDIRQQSQDAIGERELGNTYLLILPPLTLIYIVLFTSINNQVA